MKNLAVQRKRKKTSAIKKLKMGRGHEHNLPQRRYSEGRQTYKKMLKVTYLQRGIDFKENNGRFIVILEFQKVMDNYYNQITCELSLL